MQSKKFKEYFAFCGIDWWNDILKNNKLFIQLDISDSGEWVNSRLLSSSFLQIGSTVNIDWGKVYFHTLQKWTTVFI